MDDKVIPVVEELRRRLPPINAIRDGQADANELCGQHEIDAGEEDGMPCYIVILKFKQKKKIRMKILLDPAL